MVAEKLPSDEDAVESFQQEFQKVKACIVHRQIVNSYIKDG